jgi:hypothetical protein
MLWRRRNQRSSPVPLTDPTLRSFRLSLKDWSEQILGDKGNVRLWVDPEDSAITVSSLGAHQVTSRVATPGWSLQHWARFFARDTAGGLIEAEHVDLPFGPGLRFIFKTLELPAYMYHGQLVFAKNDVDIFISIVCKELGTTGVREAVITSELLSQGRLDLKEYERAFARDPYDPGYEGVDRSALRFMSDDPIYDIRFPDHPLSKVRRLLGALPGAMTFAP